MGTACCAGEGTGTDLRLEKGERPMAMNKRNILDVAQQSDTPRLGYWHIRGLG